MEPTQNFEMVPTNIRDKRSDPINTMTSGSQRTDAEMALSDFNFPFIEGARLANAIPGLGVIYLSNLPVNAARNDILAAMGGSAMVLNDKDEPVHIIIDRTSGTTTCAFVELTSSHEAQLVIDKFKSAERPPRVGDRQVEYRMSDQAELMAALFPRAYGIVWDGPYPVRIPDAQIPMGLGWLKFRGIISVEEMESLARFAEASRHANLSSCPQRSYECMISTMLKMPWYATELITVLERQSMYEAVVRMIKALYSKIQGSYRPPQLDSLLFNRLVDAGMRCSGFTVIQKDSIAFHGGLTTDKMTSYNMPRFADLWNHTFTLVPKVGVTDDMLEWYVALIRETTHDMVAQSSPEYRAKCLDESRGIPLYWGYYYKSLNFAASAGPSFDNMTLAQVADTEFSAIATIITMGLATRPFYSPQELKPDSIVDGQGSPPESQTTGQNEQMLIWIALQQQLEKHEFEQLQLEQQRSQRQQSKQRQSEQSQSEESQSQQYQSQQYKSQQYQSPQYKSQQYQSPQYKSQQNQSPQDKSQQYQSPQYKSQQNQSLQYQSPQYKSQQYQSQQYQVPSSDQKKSGPAWK